MRKSFPLHYNFITTSHTLYDAFYAWWKVYPDLKPPFDKGIGHKAYMSVQNRDDQFSGWGNLERYRQWDYLRFNRYPQFYEIPF